MNIRSFVLSILFSSVSLVSAAPECPVVFIRLMDVLSVCSRCNCDCTARLGYYGDTIPNNIRSLEAIKIAKEMDVINFTLDQDTILCKNIYKARIALQSRFMTIAIEIAKKRGAYALLEAGAGDYCVWLDNSYDITPEVVDILNKEFKANQS